MNVFIMSIVIGMAVFVKLFTDEYCDHVNQAKANYLLKEITVLCTNKNVSISF